MLLQSSQFLFQLKQRLSRSSPPLLFLYILHYLGEIEPSVALSLEIPETSCHPSDPSDTLFVFSPEELDESRPTWGLDTGFCVVINFKLLNPNQ